MARDTLGYFWMLVGMDLNPVVSVTVLLTETWYFVDLYTCRPDSRREDTLGLNVRMQSSGSNHCE